MFFFYFQDFLDASSVSAAVKGGVEPDFYHPVNEPLS